MLDARDRQVCYLEYLFDSSEFELMPWYRSQMQVFIEEFLQGGFVKIIEKTSKRRSREVSPSPSWWSQSFAGYSVRAIQEKALWRPLYKCIPYLISALPFASDADHHREMRWNKLWSLVEKNLDNQDLPEELQAFIAELNTKKEAIMQAWELGEQRLLEQGGEA